jgi:hypothetical protein
VSHRQWVFSIPKRLRPYFMYDRKLLVKLGLCAWRVLSEYLRASVSVNDPVPGCVIAVQTFGEFLNFNPHLHIIATDSCFYGNGEFMTGISPNANDLDTAFSIEVFDMLKKSKHKISRIIIDNMNTWQYIGLVIPLRFIARPCDQGSMFIAVRLWNHGIMKVQRD